MAELIWEESLSVGNESIDSDHKKLFEIFGRLNAAMVRGAGKNIIDEIVDELLNYTGYHFRREEEMFSPTEYPLVVQHRELHAEFIKRVEEFKKSLQDGKEGLLSIKVQNTLTAWLKTHIGEVDKGYSTFIRK